MTKIINAQGKGESSLISDDKDGNDKNIPRIFLISVLGIKMP